MGRLPYAIGLSLVASAMGCGDSDIEAEIDASFTPEERLAIEHAADAWSSFSTRSVLVSGAGDWLVVRAVSPTNGAGYTQRRRELIRISPDVPPDRVYAVALHEFGHALGLRHTRTGVMAPVNNATEFTPEDLEECRERGACD